MVLAIFTPQFLKNAHSATTGVIGTYIFFIIVIEFYNLIQNRGLKFKNIDFLFIFFLYFFLCLSRTEECIYFIIIFSSYSIYYIFFRIAKIENTKTQIKSQKKTIIFVGFSLLIFLIIFYTIKEFFQYFKYIYVIFGNELNNNIIYNLYESTMFKPLNLLNQALSISFFIIIILLLGTLLFIVSCYLISLKYYRFFFRIFKIFLNYCKRVSNFIANKIISKKFTQVLILPISVILILFVNVFIHSFLIEQGFLLLIELIGGYTFFILNLFIFIKGMIYYKFNNDKQNFFLLSIISSSLMMGIAFIMGNFQTSFYLLHVRFASYFIFFNLIIVQDNYFKDFMRKKKYI